MTPTEELFMEVLAARHRLGENLWTFSNRPAIVKAGRSLESRGYVWLKNGVVEHSFQAGLTEEGKAEAMDEGYISPAERRWLKADPEAVMAAVRKIMEET